MHEMALAQDIVQILHSNLKSIDLQTVTIVRLSVGVLMMVERESLQFAYQVLTEKTPLQNSKLEIIEEPLTISCNNCGNRHIVENYEYTCQNCQSTDYTIIAGREMYVKEVEIKQAS